MGKVSVKDFIIDIPKVKEELKNKKGKANNYSEHQYEVVLENNTDFVLNRKTVTTDKDLVFLISQGLFYIKNNKNEQIESITEPRLRAFFQQIYYNNFDKFTKVQWWGNKSPENRIERMMQIIDNPTMQKMYQHNVFVPRWQFDRWKDAFNNNVKLFDYCYNKIINNEVNKNNFDYILQLATVIENELNYNNAKIFIDNLCEGNMKIGLYYSGYGVNNYKVFISLMKEYNFNFNRYIDYIVQDLYSQGITDFDNDILSFYKDYLDMQVSLYGKVKEKYPKHLKTEHDIVTLKFNTYQKYKKDLLIFNVAEKYKNLGYETKEYSIILPKTSVDIVDEGINQSSCVGGYVDKIIKNESMILFMRKTGELDKSFVTIEINNGAVIQVKGFANRDTNIEENNFIKQWAELKELAVKY